MDIKEGFSLLDYEDESIESLKQLCIHCFISPNILKHSQGIKFLGFLMTIHPKCTFEFHNVIKQQISTINKNMIEIYGEIYLSALKESNGQ